jgi:magnesium transporter
VRRVEEALEDIRFALLNGGDAVTPFLSLEPADQAQALEKLSEEERDHIFANLDTETRASILEELPEDEAVELIEELSPAGIAEILDETSHDVAADILNHLSEEQAISALKQMEEADDVRSLLQYPPETAGGLMNTIDFVVKKDQTAAQVIQAIRESGVDANTPYYLYVTDDHGKLVGVIGLRSLIVSSPEAKVEEFMVSDVLKVKALADQEEVAQMMKRYRLALLPVVDDDDHLLGAIFSDDIAYILEEEATEDMFKLANISDTDIQVWSPVGFSIKGRLPWLVINLLTAFLAATVVYFFEETIQRAAVLAAFLGIVAGQGGNNGSQTVAILIRGIALGQVEWKDIKDVLRKEFLVCALNGVVIGAAVGLGAWVWQGNPYLGVVVALAMVMNMVASGIAGTIIPLSLKRMGFDPAAASQIFLTTVTDCLGFGLTLGLATLAMWQFGVSF